LATNSSFTDSIVKQVVLHISLFVNSFI